jgi:hypothetical protein
MRYTIKETIQEVEVEFIWNDNNDRYHFEVLVDSHPNFDAIWDEAEQRAKELTDEVNGETAEYETEEEIGRIGIIRYSQKQLEESLYA